MKRRNIKTKCIKDRTQFTCGLPHSCLAGPLAVSSGKAAELPLIASGELGVPIKAASSRQNTGGEQGIQEERTGLLHLALPR